MSESRSTDVLLEQLAVRQLIDDWAGWRDRREWDKIASLWHEGGVMMTTWGGTATPQEFAQAAERGYRQGDRMLHSNGGTIVELAGSRAVARTKLRIMQRGVVEGVLCDVVCIGLDYDFVEKRDGRWGFVVRQPVYERDWIVPVDPSTTVDLDPERLARFPDGYARLAYLQESLGYQIVDDMPVLEGSRVDALFAAGTQWLQGKPLAWGNG